MTSRVVTTYPDLDERFAKFDADNPAIWRHFERFTFMAIGAGREHYSAEAVMQRIRWHIDIDTKSDDGFKFNDHFRKRYALKFHLEHPQHDGFFEVREPDAGPAPGPYGRGTA